MIRAATLALAAALASATPAMALDLFMAESSLRGLGDADPARAHGAAIAACLVGQGDAARTAALFTDAGWTLTSDTDMGLNQITSSHAALSVLAATDGSFCAVYAEDTGTEIATAQMMLLVASTGLGTSVAPGTSDCTSVQLTPVIGIEVTSSGNDPVCEDAATSQVRFTFGAAG
jgi:hypothetical protein